MKENLVKETTGIKTLRYLRKSKRSKRIHLQKKAYAQFWQYSGYNGFMGGSGNFRKVDNYDQNGQYLIKNLNLSMAKKEKDDIC